MPAPMVCPAPSNGGPGVAVEVRVLRIGDALFAELMKDNRLNCKNLVTIDGNAAKEMIARVLEDSDSESLAAPRICTLSGQEGRITIGQESPFVTDLKLVRFADQPVLVPQSQTLASGCSLTVLPTITPDNSHVMIRFQAEQSEIPDSDVPTFPVTTFITPVFEGGAQGQPIPFTQFLQQPTLFKRSVTNAFGIADGQTALIYGGHTSRIEMQVERVPFFSDLPIIGDLFEMETEKQVSNHLVYMVTPQIVVAPPTPAPCQAACCPVMLPLPSTMPIATVWQHPCCPVMPLPSAMPTPAPMAAVQAANRFVAAPPALPPMPVQPPFMPPIQVQQGMCPPLPMQQPCQLPEQVQRVAPLRDVSIRCSIIKIDEAFFSRPEGEAWADLAPTALKEPCKMLDDEVAQRFCRAVRAQNGGKLVAEPCMVTREGCTATFQAGGEVSTAVGVSFVERDGATVPSFTTQRHNCGVTCDFLPRLAADGKSCQLKMEINETKVVGKRPAACEVTIRIPATDDAEEETRTETVQALNLSHQRLSSMVDISCGKCVLMYFGSDKTDDGTQHLAVLVTPTCVAEKVAPIYPTSIAPAGYRFRACDSKDDCLYPYPVAALEERMARYRRACAEERWSDARRFAVECMELDPKCFLPN
jgi:Flp pilus assembly secretin CpaC